MYRIIRIISILIPLCFTTNFTFSQGRFSIYAGIGGMYYLGDLKENALPDFRTVKLAINAGVQYNISPHFVAQINYLHGSLEGDDAYNSEQGKRNRNLRFKTKIDEISLRFNFNILRERQKRIVPYLIAGFGVFHFNPTADGVALQPLGTEGQFIPGGGYPSPYSLWQMDVPLGIGIRYRFGCHFGTKLEAV